MENAITKTYYDTENLINKIVWKFYQKYGGDIEEWKAIANLSFVSTYKKYNKSKASFPTWLYHCIWYSLLEELQIQNKQIPQNILSIEDNHTIKKIIIEDKKNHSFSALEFLDGLHEDAKTIIKLIWNPTDKLKKAKIKPGPHPCHMRKTLFDYLQTIGWSKSQIKKAFEEITRIINN